MRAAIALLPSTDVQPQLHKLALDIHRDNPGMRWVQLPFHISLKQPFTIEQVDAIDAYFTRFSSSLQPIQVTTGDPEVAEDTIFWLPVVEDAMLRRLHDRLNRELPEVVADPTAAFDGMSYRFHLSLGFLRGPNSYPSLRADLTLPSSNLLLEEAALFLYEEYEEGQWQFTTYRTAALTPS